MNGIRFTLCNLFFPSAQSIQSFYCQARSQNLRRSPDRSPVRSLSCGVCPSNSLHNVQERTSGVHSTEDNGTWLEPKTK